MRPENTFKMTPKEILEKHGLEDWGAIEGQFNNAIEAMEEYARPFKEVTEAVANYQNNKISASELYKMAKKALQNGKD